MIRVGLFAMYRRPHDRQPLAGYQRLVDARARLDDSPPRTRRADPRPERASQGHVTPKQDSYRARPMDTRADAGSGDRSADVPVMTRRGDHRRASGSRPKYGTGPCLSREFSRARIAPNSSAGWTQATMSSSMSCSARPRVEAAPIPRALIRISRSSAELSGRQRS